MKLQPGLKPEKKLKCPDLESGDNGQQKKKNKKRELVSEENYVSPSDPEKVLRGSKKKKKEMETEEAVVSLTSETGTRSKGKRKKSKEQMKTEEEEVSLTSETGTRSEGRKKKKPKEQMETEDEEVSLTSETETRSRGRKKKKPKEQMETEEEEVSLTSETGTRSRGRKKKPREQMETEERKKKKHEEQMETQEVETGTKLEGRKKKKKKTSSPPDDENSNVVMNGAETTPHGDKSEDPTPGKKKGKNKHVLENDQDTECGSSTTKVTKIKKKNKTDVLLSMDGETLDDDRVTAGETVTNEGSGKRRKQRKNQNSTETQENPTNTARAAESGNVCNGLESKKVKKKRKKEILSTEDDHGLPNAAGGDGLKTTKGKKKVTFQLEDTEDPNGNEPSEISQNDLHPKKKKKKVHDTNLQMSTWDHSQEPVIEKSKKKSKKIEKSKEEKKKQEREEESQSLERDLAAKQEELEAPKKKKRKQTGENTEELKAQKAQKIKLEEKSQDTESDVEIVSVREGNADEKQIDTVRRKALQEEIDRESGKSKRFGQWDTATFQNSEQQTKFLRLLGGFKKGNEATLKSPGQPKANMALSKAGEQTLERNLMQEFDKALGWKQNKGVGLGFQPQPKKTFYIDKTSSKSTKFED